MAKKIAAAASPESNGNGASAVAAPEAPARTGGTRGKELHSAGLETINDEMTSGFEGMTPDDPIVEKKPKGKKAAEAPAEGAAELSELEKLAQEATGAAPEAPGEAETAETDEEVAEGEDLDGEAAKPVEKPVVDTPEVQEAKKYFQSIKWADDKGALDLPKLAKHVQKVMGPAYEFATYVDKLIGEDEALRMSYWDAMERRGELTDEKAKTELSAWKKKLAETPPKRQLSKEQFDVEFKRLWNMGEEGKALELRDEYLLGPKLAAIENANRQAEEKRAKEAQEQAQAKIRAEHAAEGNRQAVALAKQVPSLLGVGSDGKAYWKNAEVQKQVSELLENVNPLKMDLEDMVYVALRRMKKTKPKPETKALPTRPSRTLSAAAKSAASRNRGKEAHLGELEVYSREVDD